VPSGSLRRIRPSFWEGSTTLVRMALSIGAALGLVLCLGAVVVAARLFGSLMSGDDQNNGPVHENVIVVCQFAPTGDEIVLYPEPNADPAAELTRLPGSQHYPIVRLTDDYAMIPLGAGNFGWTPRAGGRLVGDCSGVSAEGALPCVFTNPIQVLLYQEAERLDLIGALDPGSYPVRAAQKGAYLLQVTSDQRGWVAQIGGVLSGDCSALPIEP